MSKGKYNKTAHINVRITDDMMRRIEAICRTTGMSVSHVVRYLLLEVLNDD